MTHMGPGMLACDDPHLGSKIMYLPNRVTYQTVGGRLLADGVALLLLSQATSLSLLSTPSARKQ